MKMLTRRFRRDFHCSLSIWPEGVQGSHMIFIIRMFIWPRQKVSNQSHGVRRSLRPGVLQKLRTSQWAAPAHLCQPAPAPRVSACPLLWVRPWTDCPRQNLLGLKELIFSTVWGQETTDFFKEGEEFSKENFRPSPKRWRLRINFL